MNKILLSLLAVVMGSLLLFVASMQNKPRFATTPAMYKQITSIPSIPIAYTQTPNDEFEYFKNILFAQARTLNPGVINKVATTLACAREQHLDHNHILTIIDYSLPSNQKRLWVFDLNAKKLLFNTYVSHGIKSGTLSSRVFSNQNNSKASSIGVYKTNQTYYGRDGLSLRLDGLDKGFNDNAYNRYVVMHGGWYVDENFIKKYGRAGRSWGCPAIPINVTKELINTIKDNALFVIYYPNDRWFFQSKFLNCNQLAQAQDQSTLTSILPSFLEESNTRDDILFVDTNKNGKHEENEPIVVVTADNYQHFFHTKAPLTRMLRRQINDMEYIALNRDEFDKMTQNSTQLSSIYFVIPVIKMQRGYYATLMDFVPLGTIKEVKPHVRTDKNYTIYLNNSHIFDISSTNQFIRWLGL